MSTRQKALERICKVPPASDITWNELKRALGSLGYVMLKGSGSRRKCFHEGEQALIICHEPHPSPHVDKGCIADVAVHLARYGFTEE